MFFPPPPYALDRARLAEIYGGDAAYAAELFTLFLEVVWPEMAVMETHVAQQDWPALGRAAHKYTPSLGMVGLSVLEEKMRRIEVESKINPQPEQLGPFYRQCALEIAQMIPTLRVELQRLLFQANPGSANP